MKERLQRIGIAEIFAEYERATSKFGEFASAHEGLAVLQEEFEELKAEVFHNPRSYSRLREEAVQVGAMALRFLVDAVYPDYEFERGGVALSDPGPLEGEK